MDGVFEFLNVIPNDKSAKFLAKRRVNSSYDQGGKTGVDVNQKPTQRSKIGNWPDWSDVQKRAFCRMAGNVSKSLGYSLSY